MDDDAQSFTKPQRKKRSAPAPPPSSSSSSSSAAAAARDEDARTFHYQPPTPAAVAVAIVDTNGYATVVQQRPSPSAAGATHSRDSSRSSGFDDDATNRQTAAVAPPPTLTNQNAAIHRANQNAAGTTYLPPAELSYSTISQSVPPTAAAAVVTDQKPDEVDWSAPDRPNRRRKAPGPPSTSKHSGKSEVLRSLETGTLVLLTIISSLCVMDLTEMCITCSVVW